jgi:hypothetical protein
MFEPEEPKNEEVKSLESALRSLTPIATSLDRDRLMYLAGQASVQPVRMNLLYRSRWPLATAASIMLAALLGRATAPEQVQVVDRVVEVPVQFDQQNADEQEQFAQALQQPSQSDIDSSARELARYGVTELPLDREVLRPYLRLRDQVVALGPDMLPALGSTRRAHTAGSDSYLEMRQGLIQ